jgi:hypothetical protein
MQSWHFIQKTVEIAARERVPTGAAFPLRAQAAQSQQSPPKDTVGGNYDRTLFETWPTVPLMIVNVSEPNSCKEGCDSLPLPPSK